MKEQELKLRLRKNDFDKVHSIEQKREIMKHKERVEALYRQKLEDEKRKMNKGRIDEFDKMVQENRSMKEEVDKLKFIDGQSAKD